MKDGGVALMNNGYGEGDGRVRKAVEDALNSPLLSNNDVRNAKKILFNVSFSDEAPLLMEEMNDIRDFMKEFNRNIEVIWGTAVDNTLGSKVKMTILATGFTMDDIPQIADKHKAEAQQMTEEELRREGAHRTTTQGAEVVGEILWQCRAIYLSFLYPFAGNYLDRRGVGR